MDRIILSSLLVAASISACARPSRPLPPPILAAPSAGARRSDSCNQVSAAAVQARHPTSLIRVVESAGCDAVFDIARREPPPTNFGAADGALVRVVRRVRVRFVPSTQGSEGRLFEDDVPRAPFHVTGELLACANDPAATNPLPWSEILESLTAEGVSDGYHLSLPADSRAASCVVLHPGDVVVPTGEVVAVNAPGPSPYADAFRVRRGQRTYWVLPAHDCRREFTDEDGETRNPIGSCSALSVDEPKLDCEPDEPCWPGYLEREQQGRWR